MILLVALGVLAASPLAVPDTLVPDGSAHGAYLDARASRMVEDARTRRTNAEGAIARYSNLARSRVSIGLNTLRRERLFYRCESAVRVDWQRGSPTRMEVLGAREVIPVVSARVRAEDSDCAGAVFDPGDDRLTFATSGLIRSDSSFVRHPLAAGSEADYRFRSGDVTTMRLADGRTVRLHELEVIPRRSDSRLVSGSLWLEEESSAIVRAVLRLARPYDMSIDGGEGREDGSDVPVFFRPVRADLRFLTIEYGLWEGQWWLPRLIAYEGEAQAGGLLKLPLRVEQTYSEYRVWGDTAALSTDAERLTGPARECRPRRRRGEPEDSAARPPRTVQLRIDTDGAELEADVRSGCTCSAGRCWEIDRVVPTDSTILLQSEYLPPSIFAAGEGLMTGAELEELGRQLRVAMPAPWQLASPRFRWGPQGLDLVRYNRVEGLSVGGRLDLELGGAALDATLRLGTADLVPDVEIGLTRTTFRGDRRLAAYHRLSTVEPGNRALGLGNSLGALLFGRDDGFYYRAAGAEVVLRPVSASGFSARAFAEHQRAADARTDFALPSLWRDDVLGPNIQAEEATDVGVQMGWRGQRGLDPTRSRSTVALGLRAGAGTFRYAQPTVTLTGTAPLGMGLLGSLEVAGGGTVGAIPLQRNWYLGGASSVRGYDAGAAVGDAFWRGRAEVARAVPMVRLIAFSDAGWAGARDDITFDPPLLSVGGGVSLLDGLVRADLARGLRDGRWRLDLHLDAGL